MSTSFNLIAVAGATGAVGREILAILESRGVEASRIRALASSRSAGTFLPYAGSRLEVRSLGPHSFDGCGLALFATPSSISRCFAPEALAAGAAVVDNSSAFRHEAGVPLVIPEVNASELLTLDPERRLVANPNCSTILLLVALEPLRRTFGVRRIDVTTYQAVSGAGAAGIDELLAQTREHLAGGDLAPKVFHEPCAFNVFSHNSGVDLSSGLNGEETKIIRETRRIWNDEQVEICPTCVRVPAVRAHAEAVTVTLKTPATEAQVRAAFDGAAGVRIIDDRASNSFPTSHKATGLDDVLVGRLRRDPSQSGSSTLGTRFCLFLSGDQIRKGAALNAIQIADLLEAGWNSGPRARCVSTSA
jgi:aspartate-semialdehyde dehydrogenase